ncbi:MAG: hypothetical protein AB8B92_04015, partial [Gammaproteobacteria bacterium]
KFVISLKNNRKVSKISVEEIAPTETAIPLIIDNTPNFVDANWGASLKPIKASRTTTPWLFDDKASIYVFRFKITSATGIETILLQPAWFSTEIKEKLRQHIKTIEGG